MGLDQPAGLGARRRRRRASQERADSAGLLAIKDRRFADSLEAFLDGWLDGGVPVVIAGMAGSRMGWVEVPYVAAPAPLADLARNLMKAGRIADSDCWIVPGMNLDSADQPEVMRGEECQMLGALLKQGRSDGVFLTPGTHSKWARVADGRLIEFRTYITGELFNLLRQSGTLAQLMTGDAEDEAAFARGVRATGPDTELLNRVFSARSLALVRPAGGQGARQLSLRHAGRHRDARRARGMARPRPHRRHLHRLGRHAGALRRRAPICWASICRASTTRMFCPPPCSGSGSRPDW